MTKYLSNSFDSSSYSASSSSFLNSNLSDNFCINITEKNKSSRDLTSAQSLTFSIENEGHTLGNILRSILIRKENVSFAGYSLPHPMQNKMNLRIQTKKFSAVNTLQDALSDIENICDNLLFLYTEEEKRFKNLKKKQNNEESIKKKQKDKIEEYEQEEEKREYKNKEEDEKKEQANKKLNKEKKQKELKKNIRINVEEIEDEEENEEKEEKSMGKKKIGKGEKGLKEALKSNSKKKSL